MYYNENKHPFILLAVCVILLIALNFINNIVGANTYNNGICRHCGGTYEFKQAVGHYYWTNYMYVCNKCGNVIEISEYYN